MTETFHFIIELDNLYANRSPPDVNIEVIEKKVREWYGGTLHLAQKGTIDDEEIKFCVIKIYRRETNPSDIGSGVMEGVLSPNAYISFTRPKGVFFNMVASQLPETFVESPTAATLTLQEENTLLRKQNAILYKQLLQQLLRGTQNILF